MGGALLESPMRTAMHGKSRVSSAVSVELNCLQYLFYRNKPASSAGATWLSILSILMLKYT